MRKVEAKKGIAAGRDVKVGGDLTLQVGGDRYETTVVKNLTIRRVTEVTVPSPLEADLKAWLPRSCHDQVDWLLTQGNVTLRHLHYVVRWQGLAAPKGQLQRPLSIWLDAIAVLMMSMPIGLLSLISVYGDPHDPHIWMFSGVGFCSAAMLMYMSVAPHLYAGSLLRKLKAAPHRIRKIATR